MQFYGGVVVSTVASWQVGAYSPRACVGFLRVLWFPPEYVHVHVSLQSVPLTKVLAQNLTLVPSC